jgi:hypothetical protein
VQVVLARWIGRVVWGLFGVQARLFVGDGCLPCLEPGVVVAWVRVGERRFWKAVRIVVYVYQEEWLG